MVQDFILLFCPVVVENVVCFLFFLNLLCVLILFYLFIYLFCWQVSACISISRWSLHPPTHTHPSPHTYSHTHTHSLKHTHIHTHSLTHTHTHTYTHPPTPHTRKHTFPRSSLNRPNLLPTCFPFHKHLAKSLNDAIGGTSISREVHDDCGSLNSKACGTACYVHTTKEKE